MQFKRAVTGLTLVEILLSLVIASMILIFLVPQQLQATHEQLVNKTVAQMNQLVLAARNYYQDNRIKVSSNVLAWPTTVNQLMASGYLPSAAVCSAWPKGPASVQSNANNNGKDCGQHQEYALFPANSSGTYDTSVAGIAPAGNNSGGSFWGISLALPTAKAADEVRARLPFATACPPSELSKTNSPCSTTGNIVTAVVPRPASWPGSNAPTYSKEGLIQTMGSIVLCDNTSPSRPCSSTNFVIIDKPSPSTCGTDEYNQNLVIRLFVYPLSYQWAQKVSGDYDDLKQNYPGIQLHLVDNSANWNIIAGESGKNQLSTSSFKYISLGYFTVCQPANPSTGDWTLGYYPNN